MRIYTYLSDAEFTTIFQTNKENCNIFQKSHHQTMTDDNDDRGVIYFLISQLFSYEDDDVAAFVAGVSEEVDMAANAFGGVAVVALAIYLAWGLDVEPLGIDGSCNVSGSFKG